MLQVAGKKEGVTSLCMSAEEWSAKEGKVDRVVIRGALHHFTRWQGVSFSHFKQKANSTIHNHRKLVPEIFSGIFAKLTPGGEYRDNDGNVGLQW